MSKAIASAVCITALVFACGCDGGSNEPKPVDPPTKPLSKSETDMLDQIAAMPLKDRPNFARTNYQGLMMMSKENKAFADKLNALLAGKEGNETKN